MPIKAKEQHRLGASVNVGILDADNKVIFNRYVDAAKWDADPQAIIADIADYLAKIPVPQVPTAAVNKNAITMSDAQVTTKLAAIAAAKPKL